MKIIGKPKSISKVAVCGGVGLSVLSDAIRKKADVFITSSIDYHTIIDNLDSEITLIDAGHYYTEFPVVQKISELIKSQDDSLKIIQYKRNYFAEKVSIY